MNDEKQYLRSSEVARLFDVNPSTISLWVKKGRLRPHKTLGGNFRFRRVDIERILIKQHSPSPESGLGDSEQDRRTERRFPVVYPVQVCVPRENLLPTVRAEVRNISGRGIGLVIQDGDSLVEKLRDNQTATCAVLNLPDTLFKRPLTGVIRHFEQGPGSHVSLGILLN